MTKRIGAGRARRLLTESKSEHGYDNVAEALRKVRDEHSQVRLSGTAWLSWSGRGYAVCGDSEAAIAALPGWWP